MKDFKKLALAEFDRRFYGQPWGECEGGCGAWVPRGTVPHHANPAGIGGERKHVPEKFQFLCMNCHRKKHE